MKKFTKGKEKGRLSDKERGQIIEQITISNPIEIASKLNRDLLPIYDWLHKAMPEWRYRFKDQHKHYLDNERAAMLKNGIKLHDMDRFINGDNVPEDDLDLGDLNNVCEHLSLLETQQELIMKDLKMIKQSVQSKIKQYDKKEQQRQKEFEFNNEKAMMAKLEAMHSQIAADQKCSMAHKPVPFAQFTSRELCLSSDPEIKKDLKKGGIYFLYRDNVVRYVGRAKRLRGRLENHDKIKPNDLVAYIAYDNDKFYADELYYIWKCYPTNILNSQVRDALPKDESEITKLFDR